MEMKEERFSYTFPILSDDEKKLPPSKACCREILRFLRGEYDHKNLISSEFRVLLF